ncbi:hypothetical protein [Rhodopseudomonas sp.]|uniref:hypothetical protein n=1 Tax=Rhodopseudomonas sp. TaxID=1078 RepID=UPI003B3AF1B7
MIFLLVAGIVFLLAGAASILFGVPVKEFSFGNTLILSGVVGGCTGAILVGLSFVAREIRALAVATAAAGVAAQRPAAKSRPALPSASPEAASEEGLLFPGDRTEREVASPSPEVPAPSSSSSAPWHDEPSPRDRLRARPPEPAVAPPPPAESGPKKRNLLFSTSRRDRASRGGDSEGSEASENGSVLSQGLTRSFDEAWPDADRPRSDATPRRRRSLLGGGDEAPEAEPERPRLPEPTPAPRSEEMTEVTVLKSGVVDGMAYSLYSDGSIEAQMPEGMMRFESIDALREHLDQRG